MKRSVARKLIIAGTVLALAVSAAIAAFTVMANEFEQGMAELRIEPVDLSDVEDGTYPGVSDQRIIRVAVEVDVRGHRIVEVRIREHRNGKGEAAESILEDIVAAGNIGVEAVSGATYSSAVIQDAVQKAVTPGNNP